MSGGDTFLRCARNYADIRSISTNYLGTYVMLTDVPPWWGGSVENPFMLSHTLLFSIFSPTHLPNAHIYAREGNEVARGYWGCRGLLDDESLGN